MNSDPQRAHLLAINYAIRYENSDLLAVPSFNNTNPVAPEMDI